MDSCIFLVKSCARLGHSKSFFCADSDVVPVAGRWRLPCAHAAAAGMAGCRKEKRGLDLLGRPMRKGVLRAHPQAMQLACPRGIFKKTNSFAACRCHGQGPGLGPAAEAHFFARTKKRAAKKCAPTVCVPALRSGQPVVLGRGLRRRTRYAPKALRSNNCDESVDEVRCPSAPDQPTPCAPQAQPQGGR